MSLRHSGFQLKVTMPINDRGEGSGEGSGEARTTYGIPRRCYCGEWLNVAVDVSTTEENRGRRYYTCPASEFEAGEHIQKWWDEAIEEELTKFELRIGENEDKISTIFADPRFEFIRKSIREMRVDIDQLNKVVSRKDEEIKRLKELLKRWI